MYKKFTQFFDDKVRIAPLFIRLLIGFHLVYGTHDKIFDAEAMRSIGGFFESIHIPAPLFSACVSAWAQFLCGVCYLAGVFVRPAALIMVFNFGVAILFAHIGDAYQNTFPALTMLCGSLCLLYDGAGKFSVDNAFSPPYTGKSQKAGPGSTRY
jgi:putative oxidoreductase